MVATHYAIDYLPFLAWAARPDARATSLPGAAERTRLYEFVVFPGDDERVTRSDQR